MADKSKSNDTLLPDVLKRLEAGISEIELLTSEIKESIKHHHVSSRIWSIERSPRSKQIDRLSVNEVPCSDFQRGLSAYDLIYSIDSIIVKKKREVINDFSDGSVANVPFRMVGVVVVSTAVKYDLIKKCESLNGKKTELKDYMISSVPSAHKRQQYYRSVRPGLLVQTLYRYINVAPDNLSSVTYRWEDKATGPTVVKDDDIEKLILDSAKTKNPDEIGIDTDRLVALDNQKLPKLSAGREFVRVESIKAHPIQTIRYVGDGSDGTKPYFASANGRRRKQSRATSPLIVFSDQEFKHGVLSDYVVKTTKPIPSTYVPVIPQLRIYHREIVPSK